MEQKPPRREGIVWENPRARGKPFL